MTTDIPLSTFTWSQGAAHLGKAQSLATPACQDGDRIASQAEQQSLKLQVETISHTYAKLELHMGLVLDHPIMLALATGLVSSMTTECLVTQVIVRSAGCPGAVVKVQ